MTKAEVLTLINDEIVTNGNNDITAAVLNPVLAAIVNQINDLVGPSGGLPSGSTTVIQAINNISNTKLRNVKTIDESYVILDSDDVIIYVGSDELDEITLPNAFININRIIRIVSLYSENIVISKYLDLTGSDSIAIPSNSVIAIISDGTDWQQINNN